MIREFDGEVRYLTGHQGRPGGVTGGMKDWSRNPQAQDRVSIYIIKIPRIGIKVPKLCPNQNESRQRQ